ncbi:MAG: hypothetical protein IPG63_04110 [Xanthomonadales bacterium]|nr:hypothetical protein [Xanthomonadales bacterium]MBK7146515.1 hypothetical protein [Xanthomonadales bacterium]
MHLIRRPSLLPCIALLGLGSAQAATFTVGGSGCQFHDLQNAIDQAAMTDEADDIRIANNASYTQQALKKTDPYRVSLLGGYPDCLPASAATGLTTLRGTGLGAPVLQVGGGILALSRLVITGGVVPHGRGGGVFVEAPTERVSFGNVRITGNSALEGGGLAIEGVPGDPIDFHSQRLTIDHNQSSLAGGGLWARYAQAVKQSAGMRVEFNETGGDGGGAWFGPDAVFLHWSSKYPSGFTDNLAKGNGGGIALVRGAALVLLHAGGPAQPTEISRNAAARGGGAFLFSDTASATTLQGHNLVGHGNSARIEGGFAAVHMVGDDDGLRIGELHIDAGVALGGVPCEQPLECNVFRGNAAFGLDGEPRPGALVAIRNEGKAAVGYARFWNTTVRESLGHDLAHGWSDANSGYAEEIEFRDSLVVRNVVEKHLIETEGDGALHLFGSTFARNETGAATLQVDAASVSAYVYGSIFDDRAALIDQLPPSQSLFALMVRDPGATDGMSTVFRDDPLFEDADHDDFRLRASSPALDRMWDLPPTNALDRASNPRTIDLPGVPDFNTPRDLGCFEHP